MSWTQIAKDLDKRIQAGLKRGESLKASEKKVLSGSAERHKAPFCLNYTETFL